MGPDKDWYLSKNHKFGTRNQSLGVQNFDCGITKIVFTKAFPSTNFISFIEKNCQRKNCLFFQFINQLYSSTTPHI